MAQAIQSPTPLRRSNVSAQARTALRLVALIGILGALGYGGDTLRPSLFAGSSRAGVTMDGASWEGRRLIAQILWGQAHAVLHAGVEEREARPGEALTRKNEFHGHEGGHDGEEHEDGHVFVIPPKQEDFRGILGDLERTVKPYIAPDGKPYSKDPDQAIPLYRLMTIADPHFVQAYTTGATFIARGGARTEEGLAFLRDGERRNPDSFEIQTELGHFLLVYKKEPREAIKHLELARAHIPTGRTLTDLEADAREDTYRWLTYAYRAVGDHAKVREVAAEGIQALGGDKILERLSKEADKH